MKKLVYSCMIAACVAVTSCGQKSKSKTVDVNLANAGKTVSYTGAFVVDGESVTLSNATLESKNSNEIAVLVINGGKLVLNNCKIVKTGDGVAAEGESTTPPAMPSEGNPPAMPSDAAAQGNPPAMPSDAAAQGNPPAMPEGSTPPAMPEGSTPPAMPEGAPAGLPGPNGPGAGEDNFNFYGTNSAVVALGEGSSIVLNGCTVETDAEYANAVFSADGAEIKVENGITISTKKNSSRGLYATCAGIVNATGDINITTIGAHCAALATDRGGGFVTVGTPDSETKAFLNTSGDGSPSIYSTGDITAYNAVGVSKASQSIVVEGKNHVVVDGCDFSANDPNYGGVMLYQSFSGDAETGTATLKMSNTKIQDNGGASMFVITNTDAEVEVDNCIFLNASGEELGANDYLILCKNCNTDQRSWGTPGTNGGDVVFTAKNQKLVGKLLANESDSSIAIEVGEGADVTGLTVVASGKGACGEIVK